MFSNMKVDSPRGEHYLLPELPTCVICIEEILDPDVNSHLVSSVLNCDHTDVHSDCLYEWNSTYRNPTCPVCRNTIKNTYIENSEDSELEEDEIEEDEPAINDCKTFTLFNFLVCIVQLYISMKLFVFVDNIYTQMACWSQLILSFMVAGIPRIKTSTLILYLYCAPITSTVLVVCSFHSLRHQDDEFILGCIGYSQWFINRILYFFYHFNNRS